MIIETWYKRRQKTICSFEICLTFIIGICGIEWGISSDWFVCNNEICYLNLHYRFSSFVWNCNECFMYFVVYVHIQHTNNKMFFLYLFLLLKMNIFRYRIANYQIQSLIPLNLQKKTKKIKINKINFSKTKACATKKIHFQVPMH